MVMFVAVFAVGVGAILAAAFAHGSGVFGFLKYWALCTLTLVGLVLIGVFVGRWANSGLGLSAL
jgi:hypothetical protein